MGIIEAKIAEKIQNFFEPTYLEVENESSGHSVPAGSESHFRVFIVSAKFEGQSRVQRQRSVNEVLAQELSSGVHALAQKTLTPEEYEEGGKPHASPQCASKS